MLTVTRTKQAVLVGGEELQGYKVGGSDTLTVVKVGNKWSMVEEGILVGELFPTMKAAVEAANTVEVDNVTGTTVVGVDEAVEVEVSIDADTEVADVVLVEAVDVAVDNADVVEDMGVSVVDNVDVVVDNDMAGEEDMVVADVEVDVVGAAVDSAVVDVAVADGVVVDAVVAVPSEDGDVVVLYVVADNPMVSMAVEYADGDSLLYTETDSYELFSNCAVYNISGATYGLSTAKDLLVSAGVDVPVSDNVVSNAVIDNAVYVAVADAGIDYVTVVDVVAYADAYNVDVHDVVCYVVDAAVNTVSDMVASTMVYAAGSMMDSIAYQLVYTNHTLCTVVYDTPLYDGCVHSIDCMLTNRHHLDGKYHSYEHGVYCCTCDTAYMGIYSAPYSTCTNITYTQYVNAVYGIGCDTNYTMKGGDNHIACIVLTSLYMVIGVPYKGVCAVDVSYEDDT